MGTEVVIRRLSAEDHDSLVGFFQVIDHDFYRKNFSPHSFSKAEAMRICSHQGKDRYLGMFSIPGSRLVGYGLLRGLDEGFAVPSLGLCIMRSHHGTGLGEKLLAHMLDECAQIGCQKAMLKVKKDNPRAISLYEKAGFTFSEFNPEFLIGYKTLGEESRG